MVMDCESDAVNQKEHPTCIDARSVNTFCVRISALMGDFQVPYGAEIGIVEYCREFRKERGVRRLEATGDA